MFLPPASSPPDGITCSEENVPSGRTDRAIKLILETKRFSDPPLLNFNRAFREPICLVSQPIRTHNELQTKFISVFIRWLCGHGFTLLVYHVLVRDQHLQTYCLCLRLRQGVKNNERDTLP